MPRKSFASSARAKRPAKNAKPMPDSKLDLSDIPESTDAELRRARRVGRPVSGNAKQLIAIRIAPQLLRQLRRMAARQSKPYQTLIHELLEKSARKVASRAFFVRHCSGGFTLPSDSLFCLLPSAFYFLISSFCFLVSAF
jgi:uncharacterized protein (DUF4415 family)